MKQLIKSNTKHLEHLEKISQPSGDFMDRRQSGIEHAHLKQVPISNATCACEATSVVVQELASDSVEPASQYLKVINPMSPRT